MRWRSIRSLTFFRSFAAIFRLLTGHNDRAVEHTRHALDIDPGNGPAMTVLGEAYSRMGRHEEGTATPRTPGGSWRESSIR